MSTDVSPDDSTQTPPTNSVLLHIGGIQRLGCVCQVEKAAKQVVGVIRAEVNPVTADARLEFDPEITTIDVIDALRRSGFDASVPNADSVDDFALELDGEIEYWKQRARLCGVLLAGLALATAVPYIAIAMIRLLGLLGTGISIRAAFWVAVLSNYIRPAQILFGSLLYTYVGLPFAWRALRQLRLVNLNGDTLVGLGVTVAFGHGVYQVLFGQPPKIVFFDVGIIAGCVCLGRFLQFRIFGKLTDAVRRLRSLTPRVATMIEPGKGDREHRTETRPLSDFHSGDRILIRNGDRIPFDATVMSGESGSDESWLTGESREVGKSIGDQLLAGSLNLGGSLEATVTAATRETYLARIIEFVRKAQCSKTSGQWLADRAAFWLVPCVLLISLVTFLIWGLVNGDWHQAVRSAAAVVIVACPSALALATPAAIMAAGQRGAPQGILIKDARALETAGRLSCVLMDKTGSGTLGPAQVIRADSIGDNGVTTQNWLPMAAAAGQLASQPMASAIAGYIASDATLPTATRSETLLGEGILATVEGRQVLVGNERLLRRFRVSPNDSESLEKPSRQHSIVHVAIDGQHVGRITLRSTTDPNGGETIRQLRKLGIITMTGSDVNKEITTELGEETTDQVVSQVTLADKQSLVNKMKAAGHRVAIVGNGINDQPALAAADLGIVMGIGPPSVLDTADVVLTRGDMRQVLTVVKLARVMKSTIRWNLGWVVAYHMCLIPLAAGLFIPLTRFVPWGWLLFGQLALSPSFAAAALATSSVSVVANSHRVANRPDI